MKKFPTIAVDLDEVLAPFVPELLDWHNQKYGTQYQLNQFISYNFVEVWGGSHLEAVQKCDDFHRSRCPQLIQPLTGAFEALTLLKQKYRLIVVTSRPLEHQSFTHEWINCFFPNLFNEIVLCNHWTDRGIALKKSEACLQYGAEYLIDDLLQYIDDVTQHQITGLLFGNYPWNQSTINSYDFKRVADWNQVINYFNLNHQK